MRFHGESHSPGTGEARRNAHFVFPVAQPGTRAPVMFRCLRQLNLMNLQSEPFSNKRDD